MSCFGGVWEDLDKQGVPCMQSSMVGLSIYIKPGICLATLFLLWKSEKDEEKYRKIIIIPAKTMIYKDQIR